MALRPTFMDAVALLMVLFAPALATITPSEQEDTAGRGVAASDDAVRTDSTPPTSPGMRFRSDSCIQYHYHMVLGARREGEARQETGGFNAEVSTSNI